MHRFHFASESVTEGLVTLDRKESRHALTVLRLEAGEAVELLDGKGGGFQGVVVDTKAGRVRVSLGQALRPAENALTTAVSLAVSVIKPERMELLIQKACELGVASIFPMISERTVVRLSRERWEAKLGRWKKIAEESCKQCGQSRTPEIHPVAEFKKLAASLSQYNLVLIPTLSVPSKSLYHSLNSNINAKSVIILIGPEGDFSDTEARLALSYGAEAVTLGDLIMRSETAALFTLSVARFFYRQVVPGELNKDI